MSRTSSPAAARPALTREGGWVEAKTVHNPDTTAIAAQLEAAHEASLAIVRTHSSAATAGVQKPAGVASSVFEAGQLAKPPKRARKAVEMIDLASLVIEAGVPLPGQRKRESTLCYEATLARMAPGSSVLLSPNQARYLRVAGEKRGMKMTVRLVGIGQTRVWRLADTEPAAGAPATPATAGDLQLAPTTTGAPA